MKKITSHLSKNIYLYLAILSLSVIVIGKAILLNGCFAFDANDDANHTFTGLNTSKLLLGKMSLPYFNFFNNFGTPLMGDSLTLPFAIQAIPYYLTDANNYPWVMTINRFLISFLTLLVLVIYYRTFQIGKLPSFIAAVSVFSNFGYYWHFAHHQYQLTILIVTCILLVQKKYVSKNSYLSLIIIVGALYSIMIYSVSPNLALIGSIFFLLYTIILSRNWKFVFSCYFGFMLGAFLAMPQITAIVLGLIGSVRSSLGYAEAFGIDFSLSNLLLRTFYLSNQSDLAFNNHIYYAVYLPAFILTAFTVGGYILWRAKRFNELMTVLFLGLIPILFVWTLLLRPDIWGLIPLIKSTDVTRILWISMIFSGISIGVFFDAFLKYTLPKKAISLICLLSVLNICLAYTFGASFQIILGAWAFVVFSFGYLLRYYFNRSAIDRVTLRAVTFFKNLNFAFVLPAVMLTYVPVYFFLGNWINFLTCSSTNHFSEIKNYYSKNKIVQGETFGDSRIAIDYSSSGGFELQASSHGVHAAGGRSISMDARLQNYLIDEELISIDDPLSGYHFSNLGDSYLYAKLGINYFLTKNNIPHDGWTNVGRLSEFYIFKNKRPTSIVYARSNKFESLIPLKFQIKPNKLTFDTAGNEDKVVITLSARPGFLIYFNNKRYRYTLDSMGFILVDEPREAGHFSLVYSPFKFISECVSSGFNSNYTPLCKISSWSDSSTKNDFVGNWYCQGKRALIHRVTNKGNALLTNEQGAFGRGKVEGRRIIVNDWGVSGELSGDSQKINWSNGSYWVRRKF
jgi:hypothetical protein